MACQGDGQCLQQCKWCSDDCYFNGCYGYCGDQSYACCKPIQCDGCPAIAPKWVFNFHRKSTNNENQNLCECCSMLLELGISRINGVIKITR